VEPTAITLLRWENEAVREAAVEMRRIAAELRERNRARLRVAVRLRTMVRGVRAFANLESDTAVSH
jgi:hypothetical protein